MIMVSFNEQATEASGIKVLFRQSRPEGEDRKTFGRFERDERWVFASTLSICIRGGWPTYLLHVDYFSCSLVESQFYGLPFLRRDFNALHLPNEHRRYADWSASYKRLNYLIKNGIWSIFNIFSKLKIKYQRFMMITGSTLCFNQIKFLKRCVPSLRLVSELAR